MSTTPTWGGNDETFEALIEDLQRENTDLSQDISDLADYNNSLTKNNMELAKSHAAMAEKLGPVVRGKTFFQKEHADLAQQHTSLQTEHAGLAVQHSETLHDVDQLRAQLAQAIAVRDDLIEVNAQMAQKNADSDDQVTAWMEKYTGALAEISDLEANVIRWEQFGDKVAENEEKLSGQSKKLNEKLTLVTSYWHECQAELKKAEDALKKAEEENAGWKWWMSVYAPNVDLPKSVPKLRCSIPMVPLTPHKAPSTPSWYKHATGGKVKSIDKEIQKQMNGWNAENPSRTPRKLDFHDSGARMIPDEFEQYLEATTSEEGDEEGDDSGVFVSTPTKRKKTIIKANKPNKTVPKKPLGRKVVTNKRAAEPANKFVINITSDDETDDGDCLIVANHNSGTRRSGAGAQPREEYYDGESQVSHEEEAQDVDEEEDEEDWSVNCICGTESQTEYWVACSRCEAWSHTKCYGYDLKEAASDDFVHLCPACCPHEDENNTRGQKRQRESDEESEEYDYQTKGKRVRHNAWTDQEKSALHKCMDKHLGLVQAGKREAIYDAKLFGQLSHDISKVGVQRGANACKNIWNRELRSATGLDERRQKNPGKMATSIQ